MKTQRNIKAFILPFLAILMVILVLVGYGMLSLGFNARIKALRHTQDIYAISAAEAGMTHAIIKMNDKLNTEKTWDNSTLPSLNLYDVNLPKAFADYSFEIAGNPATNFLIKSTGRSGPATRIFAARTMLRSVYEFSILVKKNLILYPNSKVTAYNSETSETGLKVLMGTNSIGDDSVIILNGAVIDGDVLVGVSGDPNEVIKNSGTINGMATAMLLAASFPDVYPPTGLSSHGSINGPAVISGAAGSGQYKDINLGNDQTIEIVGNVVMHVTGDIDMKNGSEIKIRDDGTSSLIIYLDGDLDAKEGSGINNETGIPTNFQLYGTGSAGQVIELKAKNEFYGGVYAPNASLGIKAGGDIYGSFVGTNFELKSKSTFHHDKALNKTDINDEATFFTIRRWYEL